VRTLEVRDNRESTLASQSGTVSRGITLFVARDTNKHARLQKKLRFFSPDFSVSPGVVYLTSGERITNSRLELLVPSSLRFRVNGPFLSAFVFLHQQSRDSLRRKLVGIPRPAGRMCHVGGYKSSSTVVYSYSSLNFVINDLGKVARYRASYNSPTKDERWE
jgi:hypothetical protein